MAAKEQISIHPGVIGGHRQYPKSNTSNPKSIAKLQRAKAGLERHLESNPRDAACASRLQTLNTRIAGAA